MRRSGDRAGQLGGIYSWVFQDSRAAPSDPRVPLVLTLRVERLGVTAEVVLGRDLRGGGGAGHGERGHCVVSSRRGLRARAACEEKWLPSSRNFHLQPVAQLAVADKTGSRFFGQHRAIPWVCEPGEKDDK